MQSAAEILVPKIRILTNSINQAIKALYDTI